MNDSFPSLVIINEIHPSTNARVHWTHFHVKHYDEAIASVYTCISITHTHTRTHVVCGRWNGNLFEHFVEPTSNLGVNAKRYQANVSNNESFKLLKLLKRKWVPPLPPLLLLSPHVLRQFSSKHTHAHTRAHTHTHIHSGWIQVNCN